jgi:GTP pyrophosphokinase
MKPIIESYNLADEPLYIKSYLFIKGFATGRRLPNTLKALPLARKFHNGQYRKGTVIVDGKKVQLPYVLHVLKVCSTLISLDLLLDSKDLDILCSIALLHDCLEDAEEYFPNGGSELMTEYGMPKEVFEGVKLVSKRSGASQEELSDYFNNIKLNKLALLVKLADRSHNVEDLYNMKPEKLHKYVKETRDFIYPLCSYGKQNYPELSNGFTILKSKIVSLTELTETIVEMYEAKIKEKDAEIEKITKEKQDILMWNEDDT